MHGVWGSVLNKMPKIIVALLIQLLVLVFLAGAVYVASFFIEPPYPYWLLVAIQAVAAAWITPKFGLPNWWRWIQLLIPLGLYLGVTLGFDPFWALILFVVVGLVFSNAFKEQVPLYLTNDTTRQALKELVKRKRHVHFLDLGCGLGGNVAFMSQLKAVRESHGVETAPLPYLASKLVTTFRGGRSFAMDIWKTDLAYYDVVYAFLSPEPMPKLWEKVKEEMPTGGLFVSNSFAVPGVEPTEIWELADTRKTKLFIYQL